MGSQFEFVVSTLSTLNQTNYKILTFIKVRFKETSNLKLKNQYLKIDLIV
jgi:hypothetical protein